MFCCFLLLFAVAVLVFLTAAARTCIVTSHLLLHMDRGVALRLAAVCHKVGPAGLELAHVCCLTTLLRYLTRRCIGVSKRNLSSEKERKDILVKVFQHLAEEVEALELVDEERVLLLVCGVLYRLLQVVHIAEMLLPLVVDLEEGDSLAEGSCNLLTL